MDDQQLGGLFRTPADQAAQVARPASQHDGAPPASRDGDVEGGRRAAGRRIAVGTAITLTLVAAIAVLATGVPRRPDPSTSALAGPQPSYSAPYAPNVASSVPSAPGAPGGAADGPAPAAPAPGPQPRSDAGIRSRSLSENAAGGPGCAEPNIRVFAHLAAALPDARSTRPYAVPGGCSAGGVGVALDVVDDTAFGGASGTLLVVLTPPGVDSGAPSDTATVVSGIAPTRSGGTLRVTAGSAGNGRVPFRQRVTQLATQLAGKL